MNNELIGCCGINCEKCDARIATLNNDDELRKKTATLWSELNNAPITADMINCTGCRTEGVKTPFCDSMCKIKKCAQGKGYKTCAECSNGDECKNLSVITSNNEDAKNNLKLY